MTGGEHNHLSSRSRTIRRGEGVEEFTCGEGVERDKKYESGEVMDNEKSAERSFEQSAKRVREIYSRVVHGSAGEKSKVKLENVFAVQLPQVLTHTSDSTVMKKGPTTSFKGSHACKTHLSRTT